MTLTRWIIVACSVVLGLWMAFDGLHAFVQGQYTVPSSGPYAGQLGPWSSVLSALGVAPGHPGVKGLFVGLGMTWLAAGAMVIAGHPQGLRITLAVAVCSLWYLPVGTAISVVVIGLCLAARR